VTDNDRLLFFGALAVLGAVLAGSQSGLLSFGGGVDYDIDGDACERTGSDSFECPTQNRPRGDLDAVSSELIGEAETSELDENGASGLLRGENILVSDRDGAGVEFNGDAYAGKCTVTAGFEANDEVIVVEVPGELTDSAPLGCRTDSVSAESVELAECDYPPFDGLSQEEACREALDFSYGEYINVEYELRDDSDGDGVFDRNDQCPNEAGQLENGCANTPPTVSIDAPDRVEDEAEFTVTASATDPDGQGLSYEWSNGETGRSATYSFARSGVDRELSVTVSDGLGSVSESATVEVVDGSTSPPEGSDGRDGDSNQGVLVSVLLDLLSVLPLVSLG